MFYNETVFIGFTFGVCAPLSAAFLHWNGFSFKIYFASFLKLLVNATVYTAYFVKNIPAVCLLQTELEVDMVMCASIDN